MKWIGISIVGLIMVSCSAEVWHSWHWHLMFNKTPLPMQTNSASTNSVPLK